MELTWVTIIFGLLGLFLFYKFAKYIKNELRVAPRRNLWQKLKVFISTVIFSVILTATVLFIAAMVSTFMGTNAVWGLFREGFLTQEQFSTFFNMFLWPNLIPTILIGLGIYIIIYPFFETLFSFPQRRGSTEIHKWIENNIVDRFPAPWNYLVALFGFLGLYIIPPFIISRIITPFFLSPLSLMVFLNWFIIPPVLYLTWYAVIGSSQALFSGFKANLKKDRRKLLYLIFSFFMIISVTVNLISYIRIIFGFEMLTPSREDEGLSGFINYIVELIMTQSPLTTQQHWDNWYLFKQIIPLDFLLFFITSMLFGVLGFYGKFLNKEPLDRPILVVFASYIICGIAFQIFSNIMVKWPWILPGGFIGINFESAIVADNYASVVPIMWVFFPAVMIDKILTAVFFIYQLFFNKTLRQTIHETILTQAIGERDFTLLKKYAKDKKPELRVLVAEAISKIIDSNPDINELDKYIPICEELIIDEKIEVVNAILPGVKLLGMNNSLDKNKFFFILQLGFGTENENIIKDIRKIMIDIGKEQPELLTDLYEYLYQGYLPENVKTAIVNVLGQENLGSIFPELSYNIAMSMLSKENLQLRIGATLIIKTLISDFQLKFREIYDKMKEISISISDGVKIDDTLRGQSIEILAYISSHQDEHIEEFLADYKKFGLNLQIKEKIIGGLTQIAVSFPNYADRILPEIFEGLKSEKAQIRQDVIISLGSISLEIDQSIFLETILPKLENLSTEEDVNVKKWIINTFKFLFKIRKDLLYVERVQNLMMSYLTDSSVEISNEMALIVEDFEYIIGTGLYMKALRTTNDNRTILTLLNSFNKMLVGDYVVNLSDFEELTDQVYQMMLDIEYIRRNVDDETNQKIRILAIKIISKMVENSKSLTEKSFDFLVRNLSDDNDQISAIVLETLSKIAFNLFNNPKYYSIDFHLAQFYEDLKKFAQTDSIKKEITKLVAITNLSKYFRMDPSKHKEIYKLFYDLRKDKDPRVIAIILRNIAKISCEFQEIYFKTEESVDTRWLDQTKLESEILPLIYNHYDSKDELIIGAVTESMLMLTEIYGIYSTMRDFLFRLIKKKKKAHAKVKETSVQCITKIRTIDIEYDALNKLASYTYSNDAIVREAALKGLASIMLSLEDLKVYKKNKDKKRKKTFKLLRSAILKRKFTKDPELSIRKVFIEVATDIAIKFPDLEHAIFLIQDMALDKNEEIGILVIRSYFRYIKEKHDKLDATASCIRVFAATKSLSVKNILLKELINHYVSGEDLKYYIPTLLKLAVDKDPTIRKQSLDIFREVYEKTTEKLYYFIQLLAKLTRDKNSQIRNDSFNLVAKLTFRFPENVKQQNLVFDLFYKLSQDTDLIVRQSVSIFLENMIKIFPNRLNNTLRIIYQLLRERNREILQNCTAGLRYALLLNPEREKEIKNTIMRFYRRSANPQLQALINEFGE